MKISKPIVFFDTETTGTEITTARIVEIACYKIDADGKQTEKSIRLNPTIPIPKEASDIHGITDEMVKGCPRFIEISKSLLDFLADSDLAGYNSNRFDIPLLIEEFARCGIEFPNEDITALDVLQYERFLKPNTLSEVYKRYTGKELEGAHGALADVKATFEVLMHQTDGNDEITPTEIDLICQGDKKRFDFGGKAYIDKDNIVRWAFGKNIDKPVLEDKGYLDWVMKNEFPTELKRKLNKLRSV